MQGMKQLKGARNHIAEGMTGDSCDDGKTVAAWMTNTWSEGLNKQLKDVRQGCVRNCFVLAAIGSIVSVAPTRLSGNATSGYKFLPDGSSTEKTINIDKKLAVASNTSTDFVYARWSGDNTRKYLWPMLWEKAYARFLDQSNQHPSPKDPTQPDIGTILDGGDVKKAVKEIGRYKNFQEFSFSFTSGIPNFPSVAATSGSPPTNLKANHTYSVIGQSGTNYQLRDQCGDLYPVLSSSDLTKTKFTTWGYADTPK